MHGFLMLYEKHDLLFI